jgi:hypothetical protein
MRTTSARPAARYQSSCSSGGDRRVRGRSGLLNAAQSRGGAPCDCLRRIAAVSGVLGDTSGNALICGVRRSQGANPGCGSAARALDSPLGSRDGGLHAGAQPYLGARARARARRHDRRWGVPQGRGAAAQSFRARQCARRVAAGILGELAAPRDRSEGGARKHRAVRRVRARRRRARAACDARGAASCARSSGRRGWRRVGP